MTEDLCTEKEYRQLRALVGAMSWPVTQCVPQAAATISLLQAHINKPAVKDMLEANKCLRFLKEAVKTYVFKIRRHGDLADLRLGVYCDAAWSVRPDGSSQGGMDRLGKQEIGANVQELAFGRSTVCNDCSGRIGVGQGVLCRDGQPLWGHP